MTTPEHQLTIYIAPSHLAALNCRQQSRFIVSPALFASSRVQLQHCSHLQFFKALGPQSFVAGLSNLTYHTPPKLQPDSDFEIEYTMVKFKSTLARVRGDEFWKLEDRPTSALSVNDLEWKLDEQGYYYKSSANKDRLGDLVIRCNIGLLSYDKCKTKELKAFASKRHIDFPTDAKKGNLVATLEQADENATFDRFFDLPPELRNHIYTLHFETFSICGRPLSAPITQASRQLRQESSLLFYRTCITEISLSTFVPNRDHPLRRAVQLLATDPLRPHDSTRVLFTRMPKDLLGSIKKLELGGVVFGPGFRTYTKWQVDLACGGNHGLLDRRGDGANMDWRAGRVRSCSGEVGEAHEGRTGRDCGKRW